MYTFVVILSTSKILCYSSNHILTSVGTQYEGPDHVEIPKIVFKKSSFFFFANFPNSSQCSVVFKVPQHSSTLYCSLLLQTFTLFISYFPAHCMCMYYLQHSYFYFPLVYTFICHFGQVFIIFWLIALIYKRNFDYAIWSI